MDVMKYQQQAFTRITEYWQRCKAELEALNTCTDRQSIDEWCERVLNAHSNINLDRDVLEIMAEAMREVLANEHVEEG